MEYSITVKEYVDSVFFYVKEENTFIKIGRMIPIDNYDEQVLNSDTKKTFIVKLPENVSGKFAVRLSGYGVAGGKTNYNILDLFSNEISEVNNTIIINTPLSIKEVVIQFPSDLQDILKIDKYISLIPMDIDKSFLEKQKNKDNMILKGIDPEGKSWLSKPILTFPEWGKKDKKKFIEYLKNHTIECTVYCYGLSSFQEFDSN